MHVTPINKEQQQSVISETHRYLRLAEQITGTKLPAIPILFDLKGRTAGMYRLRGKERTIRYNPYLFAKYFSENLTTTVPHEVAHYAVERTHGIKKGIKPHGKEWRMIMHALGADSSATCRFNMDGIPTRQQRLFPYHCQCREHQLSTTRHNKIHQAKANYFCTHCGHPLTPVGQQITP